jgi:hypothetical protein
MEMDGLEAGIRNPDSDGVYDPGAVSVSPQGTPQNSPNTVNTAGGFEHTTPPGSPQKEPAFPGTPSRRSSPRPPTLPPDFAQAASHSSGDMSTSPGNPALGNGAGIDMFAKHQVSCFLGFRVLEECFGR